MGAWRKQLQERSWADYDTWEIIATLKAMVTVHIKSGQVLHTTQMIKDSFAQAG